MQAPARWILALLVVALSAAGAAWWTHGGHSAGQAAGRWWTGIQTAGASDGRSRHGKGAALEASGTIEGTLVRIASRLPGTVARVLVREGDRVSNGQVVVELEGREARAGVDQARAQLATATARYEEALAGTQAEVVREADAQVRRAAAAREGAASAVRNLGTQLERSTELKQNLDAAGSQVAATEAALRAATARLDRLRAGARPDEVQEAEQGVAAAQATSQRAGEEEERLHRAYDRGAIARRDWDLSRTEKEVSAANLARARAKLADLRAGARAEDVREAEGQVAASKAAYDGAVASLANAKQLYEDRLPAQQRLDAARAEFRASQSALDAAKAHLALLRRGTREEIRRQLRSGIDEARAALSLALSRQRDLQIHSPIQGVVSTRSVEPGEVVASGARLLEVADPHSVWVRVYLRESDYGRVRVGQRVTVAADSLPGQEFGGRVGSIAREAEFTPRSVQTKEERTTLMFAIKVNVDNRHGALVIGMPVDVRFP
jgi:HlyD family secretion protein